MLTAVAALLLLILLAASVTVMDAVRGPLAPRRRRTPALVGRPDRRPL